MKLNLLLAFAAPCRKSLAVGSLLLFVDAAISLAIPWIGGRLAHLVITGAAAGSNGIFLSLLALLALQASLKFGSSVVLGRASARILADLRKRIYDHLQSLPLSYFHRHRQGSILALMTHETNQLASFISGTLLTIGPSILAVVGAMILMSRIDPLLAAIVSLLVPVFYFVLKVVGRRLRPMSVRLQEADASVVAIANENLDMLHAIKTFTRETEESARYGKQIETVRTLSTQQMQAYGALEPLVQFLASAGAVLVLWLASERIGAGEMSGSTLVSFVLYAAVLTRPVSRLAATYGQTLMATGTLERLQDVLAERPELLHQSGPALAPVQGDIEFRNVRFAYPGRADALKNLNFTIAAGETVAITGDNGAGKSTLAHLLMRLHEPHSGQIFIDGHDIAQVGLHSLRQQIGIVPQHVLLFNGSVMENIGYGKPGASSSDIQAAARLAQADEFISALPMGYETMIGDHGVRLSGGQRQRLALARALLKNPPILILDEATAMFDPQGERSMLEACRAIFRERTVILITHRPASLALAHRVVRLDRGVVENIDSPNVLAHSAPLAQPTTS